MNKKKRLMVVFLAFCLATLGGGRDIYVATNGPNTGDPLYGTWADASSNLEWAVNAAAHSDNDIIWISNGVYVITNQIIVSNKYITISGVSPDDRPVVDASDSNRCFFFINMTGVFENIFVTRGRMNAVNGGGVRVQSCMMTIRNCIFSNNVITNAGDMYGGGMHLVTSTTTVQRCTFVGNKVVNANDEGNGRGGGLSIYSAGYTTLVDHCLFYTNTANLGGGLYDVSTLLS